MTITIQDAYTMRHELYKRSDDIRAKLAAARQNERELWERYDRTEDEAVYDAVTEANKVRRRLSKLLEATEEAIRNLKALEDTLRQMKELEGTN